jgi:hypothetical protein
MGLLPSGRIDVMVTTSALAASLHRMGDYARHHGRFSQDDNDGDETAAPEALIDRARSLIASGSNVGRSAAESLLESLASPEARRIYDLEFGYSDPIPDEREIKWPVPLEGSQFDQAPLEAVILLNADPADPDLELPEAYRDRLIAAANAVTIEQIRGSSRGDDGGLHRATPALARWAPQTLAEILRARYRLAQPTKPSWLSRAIARIGFGKPLPVSPLPPVKAIAAEQLALRESDLAPWRALSRTPERLKDSEEAFVIPLIGTSAPEQISILANLAGDAVLPDWVATILEAPSEADFDELGRHLKCATDAKSILFWLRYLRRAGLEAMPKGWQPLKNLIAHDDAEVRAAVFRLIFYADDATLADDVFMSGWTVVQGMNRDEAAYGSLVITLAPAIATGGAVGRVHRDALGDLAHRYPAHQPYLDAFADHVRGELELLRTSKSRTFPRSLLAVSKGWDELIAARESDFRAWMRPYFELVPTDVFHLFGFAEDFPLMGALDTHDRLEPGSKTRLLAVALNPENRGRGMRIGEIYAQAAKIKGDGAAEVRELALSEANNDQRLFEFATALQRHGGTDWLVCRIKEGLQGTVGQIARALTLAGFLAPSEVADQLWSGDLSATPSTGWLSDVWRVAKQQYERGCRSRHWRDQFLLSNDDAIAFGAFELFVATVDRRLFVDREDWEQGLDQCSKRRRLHWNVNGPRIKSAIETAGKKLSETFLMSEPPLSGQAPRLH